MHLKVSFDAEYLFTPSIVPFRTKMGSFWKHFWIPLEQLFDQIWTFVVKVLPKPLRHAFLKHFGRTWIHFGNNFSSLGSNFSDAFGCFWWRCFQDVFGIHLWNVFNRIWKQFVCFWIHLGNVVFMIFCYCSFRDVDVDSLFLLCFRMLHCCSFLFRSLFLLVYFTIAFHIFKVCPLFSFRATPAQNNVYFHYPLCYRIDNNLYDAFITEFELRSMIP